MISQLWRELGLESQCSGTVLYYFPAILHQPPKIKHTLGALKVLFGGASNLQVAQVKSIETELSGQRQVILRKDPPALPPHPCTSTEEDKGQVPSVT